MRFENVPLGVGRASERLLSEAQSVAFATVERRSLLEVVGMDGTPIGHTLAGTPVSSWKALRISGAQRGAFHVECRCARAISFPIARLECSNRPTWAPAALKACQPRAVYCRLSAWRPLGR